MKRGFFIFYFLFSISFCIAQNLSYGIVLKSTFYHVGNNNGTNVFTTKSDKLDNALTFGGYGEYSFNEKIGLKSEFTFTKKDIIYHFTEQPFTFNYFNIATCFKYDFGNTYREGFYILVGPKLSFLSSVKSEGEDVKSDFESFVIAPQVGIGHRVFNVIDLEAKFEYDLLPFFSLDNGNKSNFFGVVLGVTIDIERIISK